MKISFNLRVGYEEALDCVKKIEELGGDGGIVVGGSYYNGTKGQIGDLISYMREKGYDLASMALDEMPWESRERRIQELKDEGVI